jgi:hypothetical protein
VSDPKRYHLVTDGFLESEMRPCDDCLAHDEIAEEQEYIRYEDYALLKAEVERLTKAGDAMIDEWWLQLSCPERMKKSWMQEQAIVDWNAAKKKGGQS